jgi:hypothetical protein
MRQTSLRSALSVGALVAGLFLSGTENLEGQTLSGVVAEQWTAAPVQGALITLYRVVGDDENALDRAAVVPSDEEGVFEVELPGAGRYRAQAELDGLLSSLSEVIELEVGDTAENLLLMLPSPLILMAYECVEVVGDELVTVVGVARDPESQVPLPNVRVEARWQEGAITRTLAGTTDASGRYRICGVPPEARFVQLQGQLLGRMSPISEVELSAPTIVFHDVELPVSLTARGQSTPVGGGVIQERILMEAAARGLADLSGFLSDQISGEPIGQAVVRIRGTTFQTLSAGDGRFRFEGIQPGRYVLEIRHLGYNVESNELEVPAGQDVLVRLRVAPTAVVLAGIEVTTRSAVEEVARLTPFRRDIVYGEAMRIEEERGAQAFEIIRRTVPGIRVTEIYRDAGPPLVCVQTNRRVGSFEAGVCPMVQVILDGVRIDPASSGDLVRTLNAAEIESMEFLPPTQATTLYGTGGNVANGVLIIYTRGRGPYVSPLRGR